MTGQKTAQEKSLCTGDSRPLMFNFFGASVWLALNLEVNTNGMFVSLSDVHHACVQALGLSAPGPETLSKLIRRIFDVDSTLSSRLINVRGNKGVTLFKNLSPRTVTRNSTIQLPPMCRVKETKEFFAFTCPMPYVRDNIQVLCTIGFERNNFWIQVEKTKLSTGFAVPLTQSNIDGIIQLIATLNLCKGFPKDDDYFPKAFKEEKFSASFETKQMSVMRSENCNTFLELFSKQDMCPSCNILSARKKRKYYIDTCSSQGKKSKSKEKVKIPCLVPMEAKQFKKKSTIVKSKLKKSKSTKCKSTKNKLMKIKLQKNKLMKSKLPKSKLTEAHRHSRHYHREMTTSFNRIELSTGEKIYLLVKYKNEDLDEFQLSVSDGSKVWNGKFNEDDIDNMRKTLKMDYASLLKKTKDALTCECSSGWSYEYKLNSQRTEFQWNYAPDEDLTYTLGSCALKPARDPSKSMCEILNYCIDRNKEMNERLSTLQTDYDRISQERANALKRLEKCVVAKEELEKELYSKFVDVLNSKKEKIRQLKNNYTNGADSPAGPSHAGEEPKKTGVKRGNKRSAPSGDESDQEKSDADMTDEEMSTPSKGRKSKKRSPQKDDSIVLNTSDSSLGTSMVSRPRRNAEANKRKTPSKPVLPKVSSAEQRPERPVRMKKGGTGSSSTSNKSSDNIDPDDLIDNL